MFQEFLLNALSLNIGYFIELIAANIFWVFAFICAAQFFGDGKKLVLNFFVIV